MTNAHIDLTDHGLARLRAVHPSLRNEHDDICQEALIAYYGYDDGNIDEPQALMNVLIDRRAIDRLRSREARAEVETPVGGLTDLDEYAQNQGVNNDRNIFATRFDASVRDLPPSQREVYILCELRGMSTWECATFMGVPQSTIHDRLASAKANLREAL